MKKLSHYISSFGIVVLIVFMLGAIPVSLSSERVVSMISVAEDNVTICKQSDNETQSFLDMCRVADTSKEKGSELPIEVIIMLCGFGFLALLIVTLLVAYYKSMTRKGRVKKNATQYEGTIIEVRSYRPKNSYGHYSMRLKYYAYCELITQAGRRYLFKSDSVLEDISDLLGVPVGIYVNLDNPKEYYVDIERAMNYDSASTSTDY